MWLIIIIPFPKKRSDKMNTQDLEMLRNLTEEELKLRDLIIEECITALVPFAFSSYYGKILRKIKTDKLYHAPYERSKKFINLLHDRISELRNENDNLKDWVDKIITENIKLKGLMLKDWNAYGWINNNETYVDDILEYFEEGIKEIENES
jgi:hypothetical protein